MIAGALSSGGAGRHQEHRGQRTRTREQRKRERENREVPALLGLLLLAGGRRAKTGLTGKNHVDREQKKQRATGNPEGRDTDPQDPQQPIADEVEHQQDERGQHGSADRHGTPLGMSQPQCKRGKHRGDTDRVDDDEQYEEAVEQRLQAEASLTHGPASISTSGTVASSGGTPPSLLELDQREDRAANRHRT
jgi:hypothetical protein